MTCGVWVLGVFSAMPAFAAPCDISSLKLQDATITLAQVVSAGQFSPPGEQSRGAANPYKSLPEFCRSRRR
jgi:hypothetical protein